MRRLKQLQATPRYSGSFRGGFPEREAPNKLELKKGHASCVANDQNGRFVNGSLVWIIGFGDDAKSEEPSKKKKTDEDSQTFHHR